MNLRDLLTQKIDDLLQALYPDSTEEEALKFMDKTFEEFQRISQERAEEERESSS